MAPSVTVLPPIEQARASSFFTVSVVMMARAAASEPSGPAVRPAAASGIPARMAAMLRVWPMTPVEADHEVGGCAAGGPGGQPGHLLGVLVAHGAAGVGVAAVGRHAQAVPSSRCSMVT